MFSYSGNPADSDVDEIRFYLQDTEEENALITDEELEFLKETWWDLFPSNIYIAAIAAETLAAKFAREVSYSADGVSVSGEQLQQKFNDLAESLRSLYKSGSRGGGPDVGGIMLDEHFDDRIGALNFSVGMNDNRRGGAQNYGGKRRNLDEPEIDGSWD